MVCGLFFVRCTKKVLLCVFILPSVLFAQQIQQIELMPSAGWMSGIHYGLDREGEEYRRILMAVFANAFDRRFILPERWKENVVCLTASGEVIRYEAAGDHSVWHWRCGTINP